MTYLARLKAFWQSVPSRIVGSYMPDNSDGITRLHVLAPTVRPEEAAKLEAKRKALDYDAEPPPV